MIPQGPDGRAQTPILTVTLNPALDLATAAPRVVPELKLRCAAPASDPGGGGINVSRAIARMNGQSVALVALGGPAGAEVAHLLTEAGLPLIQLDAPGPTRQSISVTDRESGGQYRFVMPGPEWEPHDCAAAMAAIRAATPQGGIVVLSGSNPPGVPDDFAARLAHALTARDAALIVDTSGAQLATIAAAGAPVAILRMDDAEAEGLAARPLPERRDTAAFASELVRQGAARAVCIARGADGNIIATDTARWHVEAHKVPIVSKVGAGDSFVAGLTLGLARGLPIQDALGLAASAASATCMTPATDLCHPEDIARLYRDRVVTPI